MPDDATAVEHILTALGGAGVIVGGLLAWLGKRYLDRRLEGEQQQNKQALEKLRQRLDRGGHVYRAQFELEFKAYQEIWAASADLMDNVARFPELLSKVEVSADHEMKSEQLTKRTYADQADTALQLLITTTLRYQPFIPVEVRDLTFAFSTGCRSEIEAFWGSIVAEEGHKHDYFPDVAVKESKKSIRDIKRAFQALSTAVRDRMNALVIVDT